MGTYSGNGLLSSLRLGTHQDRFWAKARWTGCRTTSFHSPETSHALSRLHVLAAREIYRYPSGSTNRNVPYALNGNENISQSRDEKEAGRIGWTPRGRGEYVFSSITDKGKNVPLYMGPDAKYAFNKGGSASFWQWPYWNKTSYDSCRTPALDSRIIKFRVSSTLISPELYRHVRQ